MRKNTIIQGFLNTTTVEKKYVFNVSLDMQVDANNDKRLNQTRIDGQKRVEEQLQRSVIHDSVRNKSSESMSQVKDHYSQVSRLENNYQTTNLVANKANYLVVDEGSVKLSKTPNFQEKVNYNVMSPDVPMRQIKKPILDRTWSNGLKAEEYSPVSIKSEKHGWDSNVNQDMVKKGRALKVEEPSIKEVGIVINKHKQKKYQRKKVPYRELVEDVNKQIVAKEVNIVGPKYLLLSDLMKLGLTRFGSAQLNKILSKSVLINGWNVLPLEMFSKLESPPTSSYAKREIIQVMKKNLTSDDVMINFGCGKDDLTLAGLPCRVWNTDKKLYEQKMNNFLPIEDFYTMSFSFSAIYLSMVLHHMEEEYLFKLMERIFFEAQRRPVTIYVRELLVRSSEEEVIATIYDKLWPEELGSTEYLKVIYKDDLIKLYSTMKCDPVIISEAYNRINLFGTIDLRSMATRVVDEVKTEKVEKKIEEKEVKHDLKGYDWLGFGDQEEVDQDIVDKNNKSEDVKERKIDNKPGSFDWSEGEILLEDENPNKGVDGYERESKILSNRIANMKGFPVRGSSYFKRSIENMCPRIRDSYVRLLESDEKNRFGCGHTIRFGKADHGFKERNLLKYDVKEVKWVKSGELKMATTTRMFITRIKNLLGPEQLMEADVTIIYNGAGLLKSGSMNEYVINNIIRKTKFNLILIDYAINPEFKDTDRITCIRENSTPNMMAGIVASLRNKNKSYCYFTDVRTSDKTVDRSVVIKRDNALEMSIYKILLGKGFVVGMFKFGFIYEDVDMEFINFDKYFPQAFNVSEFRGLVEGKFKTNKDSSLFRNYSCRILEEQMHYFNCRQKYIGNYCYNCSEAGHLNVWFC